MKKRTKMCKCQKGGAMLLTPAQILRLQQPYGMNRFSTMPVPVRNQRGMGHCGCQYGGDFLGIGKAFKKIGKSIVSNPLRLAGAISTLGLSETFLSPAQLIRDSTGVKVSTVLDKAAPVLSKVGGPELALGSKLTSIGLKQVGLGKRRRSKSKQKRKVKKKTPKRKR